MVKIIKYKDSHIDSFYKLYLIAHNNTSLCNKIDLDVCTNAFDTDKMKIRFLNVGKKNRGYILYQDSHQSLRNDRVHIEDIFIERNFWNTVNYTYLLESINKGFFSRKYESAQLYLENNKANSFLISKLGLKSEKEVFDMKIRLNNIHKTKMINDIEFVRFQRGAHEYIRMMLQNQIFKDTKGHKDCSINDILYEEKQKYYVEDGCIFLRYNNNFVGYSQIILEDFPDIKPYIVNFGILKEFRGLGLSKLLLNHTLNLIKQKGFNEANVTVDADNKRAIRLYRKTGFSKIGALGCYIYKYKNL